MNTIFWLAIFVAVCGIGRFFLAWVVLESTKRYGNQVTRVLIEMKGVVSFLPYMWLVIGIAGLIVACTI